MWLKMITKVKNYIMNNSLMPRGSTVVLAFSYGVDSVVCLDILRNLGYNVILAHVNHKHRIESDMEEREAKALAKSLGIPIHILILNEDYSKNFHADAHEKRYNFYKSVAFEHNTNIIVTAHHLNDNAETIILNLIRGSNLYGYAGIQPRVDKEGYSFVRPLMCLTKDEIKSYQQANNLKYFEDSSNNEDYFKRNRIRHHVIPLLLNENPNLFNQLADYSKILKESFDHIRNESTQLLNLWENKINVKEYNSLDNALKNDILVLLLERLNIEKSFNLIDDIQAALVNNKPQIDVNIKDNLCFKKRYNIAYVQKQAKNSELWLQMYENDVIFVKNTRFYFTKNLPDLSAKYIKLCYNELVFPIVVRNRKPGDTIMMNYGHKKLKDLFIDLHIVREERDEAIIFENNGEILWVYDYAKSSKLQSMKEKSDIYLVYEVCNNEK